MTSLLAIPSFKYPYRPLYPPVTPMNKNLGADRFTLQFGRKSSRNRTPDDNAQLVFDRWLSTVNDPFRQLIPRPEFLSPDMTLSNIENIGASFDTGKDKLFFTERSSRPNQLLDSIPHEGYHALQAYQRQAFYLSDPQQFRQALANSFQQQIKEGSPSQHLVLGLVNNLGALHSNFEPLSHREQKQLYTWLGETIQHFENHPDHYDKQTNQLTPAGRDYAAAQINSDIRPLFTKSMLSEEMLITELLPTSINLLNDNQLKTASKPELPKAFRQGFTELVTAYFSDLDRIILNPAKLPVSLEKELDQLLHTKNGKIYLNQFPDPEQGKTALKNWLVSFQFQYQLASELNGETFSATKRNQLKLLMNPLKPDMRNRWQPAIGQGTEAVLGTLSISYLTDKPEVSVRNRLYFLGKEERAARVAGLTMTQQAYESALDGDNWYFPNTPTRSLKRQLKAVTYSLAFMKTLDDFTSTLKKIDVADKELSSVRQIYCSPLRMVDC